MWRFLTLILLVLNGLYLAWGQGWLLAYGVGPATPREPQRLAQQLSPDKLTLVRPDDPALAAALAPATCLQSVLMDEAQAGSVRELLESAKPANGWLLEYHARQGYQLRFPVVDGSLQPLLPALQHILGGQALTPCGAATNAG